MSYTGLQFSSQSWSAIFAGLQTLIILIGTIVALRNLKVISKTHKLNAIEKFTEDLVNFEEDRKFLYQKFNFNEKEQLTNEEEGHVQNVINSLNRISMLIDNYLISARVVFPLCHTMIIRCEYKLSGYIEHKEKMIGGRYGRRIIRLAKRAKQFHDSNAYHRISIIKIQDDSQKNHDVYMTVLQTGFLTARAQKLEWWIRRKFHWY